MSTLQMRKVWEYDDQSLFLKEQCRFTVAGYTKYWLAIDHLIKLWDSFLGPKYHKKLVTLSDTLKLQCSQETATDKDPGVTSPVNKLKSVVTKPKL